MPTKVNGGAVHAIDALRRLVAAMGGNPLAMDNNATLKASRNVLTKKTVEKL